MILVALVLVSMGGRWLSAMPPRNAVGVSCPRLAASNRPALLFVEGPPDQAHLFVAYNDGHGIHREPIASAKYLRVTQLGNAVFLVTTLEDTDHGEVFALNFESGVVKRVGKPRQISCLRAEPARQTAMLVEFDESAGTVRLIELGFARLETSERAVLRKAQLGKAFEGLGPRMKVSPDFRHIAYVSMTDARPGGRRSEWSLRLLDVKTLQSSILDRHVNVEISMASSWSNGRPPFEWTSTSQLVYQDMAPNDEPGMDRARGTYVYKAVDINTGAISECFRNEGGLTLDGGSLDADPLTGILLYNREQVLDPAAKAITDRNLPFSVKTTWQPLTTEIMSGTRPLYRGSAMCLAVCVSASRERIAYLLRPAGGDSLAGEIFAVFRHDDSPIRIARGSSGPTAPAGWIE